MNAPASLTAIRDDERRESEVGDRIRIRYAKTGKVRFIGHRDLARVWERSFRRAGLKTRFSEGFTPHPKISFGAALPVAWESVAEYLDVSLAVGTSPGEVAKRLDEALPEGIAIVDARRIEGRPRSLSSVVERADYSVLFAVAGDDGWEPVRREALEEQLSAIVGSTSLVASRMKKGEKVVDDIRPLIFDLRIVEPGSTDSTIRPGSGVVVGMTLAMQPRVVRPEEIAALITERGLASEAALIRREAQYALVDGELVEPMAQAFIGGGDSA